MARWGFAVRALKSRNYQLYFAGQTVSLIGTWMTRLAMSWLVYRLTGSPVLLGLVSFCGQVPTFFLGPVAGVWVDRWNRHRTLVVTQALSMAQSFALAGLTLGGVITTRHLIVLSLAQGFINAFDMPARQSFLVQMVDDREDLPNAIALNSSMVNAARLLGPTAAGMTIAAVGEGYCFLIDGISYVAVIASLLAMRVRPVAPRAVIRSVAGELREGWRYVSESKAMRAILLLLALVSLVGMPYSVLMPVFAGRVLGGGPHTLGFLMAASGVGALAGAVTLAMRRTVLGLGKRISVAAALFGVSLIGFALSRQLWLSLLLLPLTGFGMIQQMASSNTILQTIADDERRGRVMAYYSMAFQGMAPFGSLLAGWMADRIGAPGTLMIGGALCIAGAAWFRSRLSEIRRVVRPIYVQLGILPEQ
jgi:MFS family permease